MNRSALRKTHGKGGENARLRANHLKRRQQLRSPTERFGPPLRHNPLCGILCPRGGKPTTEKFSHMQKAVLLVLCLVVSLAVSAQAQVCGPVKGRAKPVYTEIVAPACKPQLPLPCERECARLVVPERFCQIPLAPEGMLVRQRSMPCDTADRGFGYLGINPPGNGRNSPAGSR